jgi:hypothetical protein
MMRGLAFITLLVCACGDNTRGDPDGAAPPPPDSAPADAPTCEPEVYEEDLSACTPLATYYQPRDNMSADDAWPACISDDNEYHRIEQTISTIARVEAFEQIALILGWSIPAEPTMQEFIDARVIYAQDQGLDSRVQRRQDVHYPPLPDGMACTDAGVPEQYPDRCAGPAKLLPILNDAFADGATGEGSPRVNAARVEAALIWFLYLSPLSEVMSCTQTPRDCDSCWAYYTGGTPRDQPIGLASYVRAIAPDTHDWAYDATLAVRCWRNLDNETGEATNLELRDDAFEQLDRALVRGVAMILRHRFALLACSTGDIRDARFAFIQIIGPLLDREARLRDPAAADVLLAESTRATTDDVDPTAAIAALDALFPCP